MPHPWISSYPSDVSWDSPIPALPAHAVLQGAAARFGPLPAVDFLGAKTSYAELYALARRAAAGFQALGVGKGVRVGLYLPNCPFFLISYFGVLMAGGTVVNCSPLYTAAELAHQALDSGMRLIVTANLAALYPNARALLDEGCVEKAVVFPFEEALPLPARLITKCLGRFCAKLPQLSAIPHDARHVSGKALLAHKDAPAPVTIHPHEDIAVLQYTGGTTGTPKGAMLAHANLSANLHQIAQWYGAKLEPGREKMIGLLPLFHIFSLTVVGSFALHMGMEIVLYPKRPDLGALLKDIAGKRATILPGVPALFAALAKHPATPSTDLSSLKFCVSGGDALPSQTREAFEEAARTRILEGYGLSETSPVICSQYPGEKPRAGDVGQPLPGTEIVIVDPENPSREMPSGQDGEILARGPQVMKGYHNRPEETAAVMQNGGFLTGDIGHLDGEGRLTITGRKKEMIAVSGFKVYPVQVEAAILSHPAVAEAAALGVADAASGQRVRAHVVLKEGAALTETELLAYLRERLNKAALPREIVFQESLPRTMIGKVDRKALMASGTSRA